MLMSATLKKSREAIRVEALVLSGSREESSTHSLVSSGRESDSCSTAHATEVLANSSTPLAARSMRCTGNKRAPVIRSCVNENGSWQMENGTVEEENACARENGTVEEANAVWHHIV